MMVRFLSYIDPLTSPRPLKNNQKKNVFKVGLTKLSGSAHSWPWYVTLGILALQRVFVDLDIKLRSSTFL